MVWLTLSTHIEFPSLANNRNSLHFTFTALRSFQKAKPVSSTICVGLRDHCEDFAARNPAWLCRTSDPSSWKNKSPDYPSSLSEFSYSRTLGPPQKGSALRFPRCEPKHRKCWISFWPFSNLSTSSESEFAVPDYSANKARWWVDSWVPFNL